MSVENVEEEVALEAQVPAGPVHANNCLPARVTRLCEKTLAFKFGGTSLEGADRIRHSAGLVQSAALESHVVVVVSAMRGVTDRLLAAARALGEHEYRRAREEAERILDLHHSVLAALKLKAEISDRVRHDLALLGRDLLHEVAFRDGHANQAETFDRLASFGERFSSRLFAAALQQAGVPAVPVSSSDFVLTCDNFREAQPELEKTRHSGRQLLLPLLGHGIVPVVTGFIGSTDDGRITTLGRNSSDFSGAIIAHVVDADELVIWTDVDGIYTENPHVSREARLLHELSYEEAYALAASGAKVLHAKVLPLAAESEMIVWVRNTFNPAARGTRIAPKSRGVK
jgi:bifunctional aspartokinase / homoserine dehydrogenase 1